MNILHSYETGLDLAVDRFKAEHARLDARLKAAQLLEGRADRAGWELRDGLGAMMRAGAGRAPSRG